MRHGNVEFLGRDRAGQGRIDVAHYQHGRGPLGDAQFLERHHDLGGLGRVAAAAGAHEDIRLRNPEFFKKHIIHFAVVMLAGMDDFEGQHILGLQGAHDRGDFHEVGPRTSDQIDQRHSHPSLSKLQL